MLGFDTQFWFASEFLRDGDLDYLAFVNFDRVDVRRAVWKPNGTFTVAQPDFFHVTAMEWDRDSVEIGATANLRLHSVNPLGRWVRLGAIEVDASPATNEFVSARALGLPDSVWVTDTLTVVPWVARGWTDDGDTDPTTAELAWRTGDATATAPVIVVTPVGGCSGSGDPGEIIDPALVADDGAPRMRALHRTPVSDGAALLLESAEPVHARLEIYDVQGRWLGTLADRDFPAGASVVPWSRAADASGDVPGVRFVRMVTPRGDRWARIVVTR